LVDELPWPAGSSERAVASFMFSKATGEVGSRSDVKGPCVEVLEDVNVTRHGNYDRPERTRTVDLYRVKETTKDYIVGSSAFTLRLVF
jgi:hypothetical protein